MSNIQDRVTSLYNKAIQERNEKYIAIKKLYDSLPIPKKYRYLPNLLDCGYYVGVSVRKRYKTTNGLIGGLCANKLFNWEMIYFRSTKDETKGDLLSDLFNVIKQYNYISEIYGGQYNDVKYYRTKYFTLINTETGEESDPILTAVNVEDYLKYTSLLNKPLANWWIYDEFITVYRPDTFIHFMSIHSTILRERLDVFCMLFGNTIDRNNRWFDELGLRPYIKTMKQGQSKLCETKKGTIIRFELFDKLEDNSDNNILRLVINKLFYGFDNEKMTVITDDGDTWATSSYTAIQYHDDDIVLYNGIKMLYNLQKYSLTVVYNETLGVHLNIKPFNDMLTDDDILIVFDTPINKNEIYGLASIDILAECIRNKRVYFSDSYTANDFEACVKYYNKTR